jgi:hypothetical protein
MFLSSKPDDSLSFEGEVETDEKWKNRISAPAGPVDSAGGSRGGGVGAVVSG